MAEQKVLHAASVEYESNGRVYISAERSGFPAGFELERGDQVALVVDERGNLAVKPLVRATHAIARGPDRGRESFTVFLVDGTGGSKVIAARPSIAAQS
jgi:hypothetical protein